MRGGSGALLLMLLLLLLVLGTAGILVGRHGEELVDAVKIKPLLCASKTRAAFTGWDVG
jgi:hypothetical protein